MRLAARALLGGMTAWLFVLSLADPSATSRPVRAEGQMEARLEVSYQF